MILKYFLSLMVLGLAGCSSLPSSTGLKPYTNIPAVERASPNFGARRPNFVIIHHTSDNTAEDSLRTLTTPRFEVSSHYLIGREIGRAHV